jgi:hypothetical protein
MQLHKTEKGFKLTVPGVFGYSACYPWDATMPGLLYHNCVELFEEETADCIEVVIAARIYDNFKFCYKLEKKF